MSSVDCPGVCEERARNVCLSQGNCGETNKDCPGSCWNNQCVLSLENAIQQYAHSRIVHDSVVYFESTLRVAAHPTTTAVARAAGSPADVK